MPNGLIYQWGKTEESHNANDYHYFPIPFENTDIVTLVVSNTPIDGGAWIKIIDKTKFLTGVGHNINGSAPMSWYAISYNKN